MRWDRQRGLVKLYREKTCMSQDALSCILGYQSLQNVSNLERGKSGVPLNKIYMYCKVLKIDKYDLIDAIMLDYADHLDEKYIEGLGRVDPPVMDTLAIYNMDQTIEPSPIL